MDVSPNISNSIRFTLKFRHVIVQSYLLADAVQESVTQWLSKTQSFFSEVTSPLVKSVNDRKPNLQNESEDMEDMLITEQTVDSKTPGGELSEAAIISIEQFSRYSHCFILSYF